MNSYFYANLNYVETGSYLYIISNLASDRLQEKSQISGDFQRQELFTTCPLLGISQHELLYMYLRAPAGSLGMLFTCCNDKVLDKFTSLRQV